MLKIKVKERTHQTIAVISKYLCILGFIGAVGFFGYTMVQNYRQATTILNDAQIIDAELMLTDVTFEKGRKGRTKSVYEFTYSYEADGQAFAQSFTTSESNADKYVDATTIPVAYAKSNPALSGKLNQLEKNSSLGSLSWRGLVAFLGLMFLAAVIHGLITGVIFVNRDDPENQS
ncbi:DUF3592 domain-containing protein [Marinicella sediminis]|uniref:DUF3592 domain-containing protein n=1 Tax=Marinicella sediminis TaxID=1792834 RepID=A0ABV7J3V5_9GAMM|nr:DUF3592 domain-containing protein [Marinicella sediminis]